MRQAFNITYQLSWRFADAEDSHMTVAVTWKTFDADYSSRWWGLILPVSYEESQDGSFQERARQRVASYEEECECYVPLVLSFATMQDEQRCEYHRWLQKQWEEEDEDAVDSWRETRDDLDAMMRRLTRKIKREGQPEDA